MNRILFIGSFRGTKDGTYGGVYFACTTLKSALEINGYKIIKLDITLKSIKNTEVFERLPSLIIRNFIFLWKIAVNRKAKNLIVFLSAGNSYLDKLPSILLARILQKKIIIFPVSGFVIHDYESMFYKKIIDWTIKLSDIVVCQSDFWKNFFHDHNVSEPKLKVIENWVSDLTIKKSNDISFREYLPQREKTFKLVFVSRIEVAKGVIDIIELAKMLKDIFPFEITIYGDGSYTNKLKMEIERSQLSNYVKFNGWLYQEDMQQEINKHHIAIFTSRFEGYPNALLDYIFSKIPIIATNIPMVRAVGRDLITYYDAGNVDELVEKVIWCRNNYSEIVKMSEKLFLEKESHNNLMSQTMNIINLFKINNN